MGGGDEWRVGESVGEGDIQRVGESVGGGDIWRVGESLRTASSKAIFLTTDISAGGVGVKEALLDGDAEVNTKSLIFHFFRLGEGVGECS